MTNPRSSPRLEPSGNVLQVHQSRASRDVAPPGDSIGSA